MRIKSNLSSNVAETVNGLRVLFPAGGILELDDTKFKAHLPFIQMHVAKGNFEMLKQPTLSKEEQAKADEELEASLRKQMAELKARQTATNEDKE